MADTRALVRQYAAEYPHASMAEVARVVGVSRERVRQIADEEGLRFGQPTIGGGGSECTRQRIPAPAAPPRQLTGGLSVPLNATAAGTAAELLVAADLTARGYFVFFPLVRTALCDLVTVDRTGAVERIEVRTAYRGNGRLHYRTPDRSRSDRTALVISGEPVQYRPPYEHDPNPRRGRGFRRGWVQPTSETDSADE